MNGKTFSRLCKDLYEPLIEKESEELQARMSRLTSEYASRGFALPPGAMYADIGKCYKDTLPVRAKIVFDSCCEVYEGSIKKPRAEVFTKEIAEAIQLEQERILTLGKRYYEHYNNQSNIPSYNIILERYSADIFTEGGRQSRYYSSKAQVFLGDVTASMRVDNPLDLTPNFFGIGIDLKRIIPWFKMKFRK